MPNTNKAARKRVRRGIDDISDRAGASYIAGRTTGQGTADGTVRGGVVRLLEQRRWGKTVVKVKRLGRPKLAACDDKSGGRGPRTWDVESIAASALLCLRSACRRAGNGEEEGMVAQGR